MGVVGWFVGKAVVGGDVGDGVGGGVGVVTWIVSRLAKESTFSLKAVAYVSRFSEESKALSTISPRFGSDASDCNNCTVKIMVKLPPLPV